MILEVIFTQQTLRVYDDEALVYSDNTPQIEMTLDDVETVMCTEDKLRVVGDFTVDDVTV